jgi:hypothetical protein
MPFTTVPDKTTGDVVTETMWDTYIRDNINLLSAAPTVRGYAERTTNYTTTTVAASLIALPAITFDGAAKVDVQFYCPYVFCESLIVYFYFYVDGVDVNLPFGYSAEPANGTSVEGVIANYTPAAGSRVLSVWVRSNNSGATLYGGAGGAGNYVPMFVRCTTPGGSL